MILSSSESVHTVPVTSFSYRDIASSGSSAKERVPAEAQEPTEGGVPALLQQQMNEQLQRTRAEAIAETEARLKREYEGRSWAEAEKIRHALDLFIEERKSYFSRVEADVVQLALAIATRILHREAQVDPMLIAALVRVAVGKMHDGSSVSVRIAPAAAERWRAYFATPLNGSTIAIVEDTHLGADDCILETDLGSASFSIEAQLKEVEQGFFDLLAQRPASR